MKATCPHCGEKFNLPESGAPTTHLEAAKGALLRMHPKGKEGSKAHEAAESKEYEAKEPPHKEG